MRQPPASAGRAQLRIGRVQQVGHQRLPDGGDVHQPGVRRKGVRVDVDEPTVAVGVERDQPGGGLAQPGRHPGAAEAVGEGEQGTQLVLGDGVRREVSGGQVCGDAGVHDPQPAGSAAGEQGGGEGGVDELGGDGEVAAVDGLSARGERAGEQVIVGGGHGPCDSAASAQHRVGGELRGDREPLRCAARGLLGGFPVRIGVLGEPQQSLLVQLPGRAGQLPILLIGDQQQVQGQRECGQWHGRGVDHRSEERLAVDIAGGSQGGDVGTSEREQLDDREAGQQGPQPGAEGPRPICGPAPEHDSRRAVPQRGFQVVDEALGRDRALVDAVEDEGKAVRGGAVGHRGGQGGEPVLQLPHVGDGVQADVDDLDVAGSQVAQRP